MEVKVDILKPFFQEPTRKYLIREIARILGINHTTVRKYLNYYTKESLLLVKKSQPYSCYVANVESKKYLNAKLYFNLELIRESNIIEKLEQNYDYPPIVLFGSFAKAIDDKNSDIDICVISNINKNIDFSEEEKVLARKISIHRFSKQSFDAAKKNNPELINNVINGITLSGQLEVL